MSTQNFEYDVFLNYASEDTDRCEMLAGSLRNEGVRVWFDKPGTRLNEVLRKSHKMVAVWSTNYFNDEKAWIITESFRRLNPDPLSKDRLLVPLMLEDCDVLPTFQDIPYIDFRNPNDFDIRFRELLEALDLPPRESEQEEDSESHEHELNASERGKQSHERGKRFEDKVAALYRLLGFEVTQDVQLSGVQIDIQIQKKEGGLPVKAIVECRDKRITSKERDQILAQQSLARHKLPAHLWIAVSTEGFAAGTRTALEEVGIHCTTYPNLLRELVPLDNYVDGLISEIEKWRVEHWRGEDWFIEPNLLTDITHEKHPSLTYIDKWINEPRASLLTVLGDIGAGKTTLARTLAYNLAKNYHEAPLHHPAPVLIPLKEVRKELSLEGIIVKHFSYRGLPEISFPRFEHLVRLGKIILLFDAFDEMADRVHWEVTLSNFRELNRAAESNGKVILTCRTHYFKDRDELMKLIDEDSRLPEIETELYRELRQQSGAEVVYLQKFNDSQIHEYLRKAHPHTANEDWQKIQDTYNLRGLARLPLLLDMIVKSLPKFDAEQIINAANLYTIYTNAWIEREMRKDRLLIDKNAKLGLMLELAWRLWDEEKDAIHYRELASFVENLVAGKRMEFGDEEVQDIAHEMQTATFLKRYETGNFSFVHRSFMEYFLARKLYESLINPNSEDAAKKVLNTRRFDRKIIYFLTLLDESHQIRNLLPRILTKGYLPNVSENALQILYWCERIRCGMEEKVVDPERLRNALARCLSGAIQLAGADLRKIVLEAADLTEANFSNADLTQANLNYACLARANFYKAKLVGARIENAIVSGVNFREADLNGVSFIGTNLDESNLTEARMWRYIRNPYLPGKPDPDLKEVERLFVGREDVLRFIEENLVDAAAERIVVLYGHRRTGKTWTLLHLQDRLPATYLPVYINVQEFTGVSGVPAVLQIFVDEILRTVKERCEVDEAVLSSIHIPTFEEYEQNYPYYFKRVFLRDIQEVLGERKLLWLFDEFQGLDDMVASGNLPATFMEFLSDVRLGFCTMD